MREPRHITAHKRQHRQAMWEKQKEHDEELLKSELARQDKNKCGWGGQAARPCVLSLPQSVPQSMGRIRKYFVALELRQPLD